MADGHEVHVWSGEGRRFKVIRDHGLDELVTGFRASSRVQVAEVRISYGSSGNLFAQIANGAPADIFISADVVQMEYLERSGAVTPGSSRPLVGNALAVEAKGAVDAGKTSRIVKRSRRERTANRPVRGDPDGEQDRIISQAGEAVGVGAVAAAVTGPELVEERFRRRREPGAAVESVRSRAIVRALGQPDPASGAAAAGSAVGPLGLG